MELNYLINKIFTDIVITLSYNFNISIQTIGTISFLVAMYAFLDIFAGSGASEYRMGYWFYAYLKKVPKFLPSSADVPLAVVFGLARYSSPFQPPSDYKQIISNSNSNDFVYSKTAGKSLFTEERIILKNVNSKQLIIYANSDSILVDRIISSIKFY